MTGEAAPQRVGPRLRGGFGKFAGDSTKGTGMRCWLTVDTATPTIVCAAYRRIGQNITRTGQRAADSKRHLRALRERGNNGATIRLRLPELRKPL